MFATKKISVFVYFIQSWFGFNTEPHDLDADKGRGWHCEFHLLQWFVFKHYNGTYLTYFCKGLMKLCFKVFCNKFTSTIPLCYSHDHVSCLFLVYFCISFVSAQKTWDSRMSFGLLLWFSFYFYFKC